VARVDVHKHILSDKDAWFLAKNRIDALSRSQFAIGDSVVVCINKHVMLTDFYDGECPTCKSKSTTPFSFSSVEHGYKLTESDLWFVSKNPKDTLSKKKFVVGDIVIVCDNHHMTLLDSFSGRCPVCYSDKKSSIPIRKELFCWLFPTNSTKRLIKWLNFLLGWMFVVVVISVVALTLTSVISHELFLDYWRTTATQKTALIYSSINEFLALHYVYIEFRDSWNLLNVSNNALSNYFINVSALFAYDSIYFFDVFRARSFSFHSYNVDMVGQLHTRTRLLSETIIKQLNEIWNLLK